MSFKTLRAHYDLLPQAQQKVLRELDKIPAGFVLYGGTAVALHLGHRSSIDFDFFSSDSYTLDDVKTSLSFIGIHEILQAEKNTLTLLVNSPDWVKISFFWNITTGRIAPPLRLGKNHILIASLEDLLAHKLKTIFERIEIKDYIDVAAILRAGFSLQRGLEGALALWRDLPAMEALRALTYFQGADFENLSPEDKDILIQASRDVSLDTIKPSPLDHWSLA
jgi:predicted nucleotidyltransferase